MNTRTPRTLSHNQKSGPSLGRAGIGVGVVLLASLGIGLFLSGDEEPTRPAKPSTARVVPARPAADRSASMTVTPAAATADAGDVAPATGPVVADSGTVAEASTEPVSYAEAEAAYLDGDWSRAAELFARYTEQTPSNPWGHYMGGLAHRQTGDLAGSEAAFRACLDIDPDHVKSLVNLARTCLDDGRPVDAAEAATRAVEIDAENGDAHRVLARALHSQGRTEDALAGYATALAIDPEDAWSLNNRGLILIESGRFDEAVEPLRAACDVDDTQAVFRNNLGVALERTGRYREAEAAYAAALAIDSGYEKAAVSLARVEVLGEDDDEPVLAAAPESPEDAEPLVDRP